MRLRLFQQTALSKMRTLSSPCLFQPTLGRSALLTQSRFVCTRMPLCDPSSEKHLQQNLPSTTEIELIDLHDSCSPQNLSVVLVEAVLHGDKAIAKKMLEANPVLLLKRELAIDFSGRPFSGTAFQAALCAGDVEIGAMMKEYFDSLSSDFSIMQQQFDSIFPPECGGLDGYLAKQARTTFDFTPINAAIKAALPDDVEKALAMHENGSTLCRELNNFRRVFTQHSHHEKVFNPQHVLRAFELYDTLWESVPPTDKNNYAKRALFWRQILGFAQRFLPACDAQVFAYGLYDIFANERVCPRSFKFRYDPSYSFYPLLDSRSGIGFEMAAISGSGRGAPYCLLRGGSRLCYKAYVEQKNQVWRKFLADSRSRIHQPMKKL